MFNFTFIIFLSSLVIIESALLFRAKRNKHFVPLLILCLLVSYGAAVGFGFIHIQDNTVLDAWMSLLSFFTVFLLSLSSVCLLFKESYLYLIDTCLEGYTLQHIASTIVSLIYAHWKPIASDPGELNWFLIALMVYPVIYVIGVFLISKMRKKYGQIDDIRVTLVAIPLVFMCFFLHRIDALFSLPHPNEFALFFYPLIICVLTLLLQSGILHENKNEKELETAKSMLEKERQEYASWKNSVDTINLKCHNLKYMLRDYRKNQDEKKLDEIENAVLIYDSAIKTGNETLDILLFEKSEECQKKKIEFTYLVDGKQLSFMEKEDVLVLFNNIIDNAIEGVESLPEEKRVISLKVILTNGVVAILEENYARDNIVLKDGLPMTNKKDKDFHGFGTRSIKLIAEQYGGTCLFETKDGKFSLHIAIPMMKH